MRLKNFLLLSTLHSMEFKNRKSSPLEMDMSDTRSETRVVLAAAGKGLNDHVWSPDGDVQSIWKRHGWTPPSERGNNPRKVVQRTAPSAQPQLRLLRG
jgi:hypothetical protein